MSNLPFKPAGAAFAAVVAGLAGQAGVDAQALADRAAKAQPEMDLSGLDAGAEPLGGRDAAAAADTGDVPLG